MSIATQIQSKTLTALVAAVLSLTASAQSVYLTFNAPVPGTLNDVNGNGTGFTHRLIGTGSSLPANDPTLQLSGSTISLSATRTQFAGGGNGFGFDIASVPCMTWFALPGHDATVSAKFVGVPAMPTNSALGLFIGTSTTDYVLYHLTDSGVIGMTYPGGWATYGSGYGAGNDVEITLSRTGDSWLGTWNNFSSNTSGGTGAQLQGYLTGSQNYYVGVFAFSPNFSQPLFVANLDHFELAAPCSQPTPNPPGGPLGPNTVSWQTVSGGNDHQYEVVPTPCGITWLEAATAAIAAGGHLATPTSTAENVFVYGLLGPSTFLNDEGPWIGGIQPALSAEPIGGWRWVTGGEPFAYANWAAGQPDNNGGSANRIRFAGAASYGAWSDGGDTDTALAYIVEYEPSLPCSPPASTAFTLCAAYNAAGDARLQLFNLPTDTLYGKTLISTAAATPLGSGSFFGLNADLFTLTVLLAPPQIGDPLSWWSTEPGLFPDAPYLFPPGLMLPFAGTTWDLVAVAVTTTGTIHFSNFVQNTW